MQNRGQNRTREIRPSGIVEGLQETWPVGALTSTRRAQQQAATAFGIIGVAVLALGLTTVAYFATGSRLPGFGASRAGARTCVDLPEAGKVSAAP